MGLYLKTLLFIFLKFGVIHGGNPCPPSSCGNSTLQVRYPFKFESQTPSNNCRYISLNCNKTLSKTIVKFPFAGDFYVHDIDYQEQYIQLDDPGECLMKRIMNFSYESSPFRADYYDNYTYYVCPWNSTIFDFVTPIDCLSNSTNKTFASTEVLGDLRHRYGCSPIGSWLLPVQYPGTDNYSFMSLTWDASVCRACFIVDDGDDNDDYHEPREEGSKSTKMLAIFMSMPALAIIVSSCCSIFCLRAARMIGKKFVSGSAAAPQTTIATALPPPFTANNTGLNEARIIACTELVVLDKGIPSATGNTCSICLDNYDQEEVIRVISTCGHCFHAGCIEQWLQKNGICPVCRTSLSDAAL